VPAPEPLWGERLNESGRETVTRRTIQKTTGKRKADLRSRWDITVLISEPWIN
jgi:hypothetical protein